MSEVKKYNSLPIFLLGPGHGSNRVLKDSRGSNQEGPTGGDGREARVS